MQATTEISAKSCGKLLDMSPEAWGELRDSYPDIDDAAEIRRRIAEDGYLFFRGFFDPNDVAVARGQVTEHLAGKGLLEDSAPAIEAVVDPARLSECRKCVSEEYSFPAVRGLLHEGNLVEFFGRLFDEEARSLDHIWMRLVPPGEATAPHYDIVYMSRGSQRLHTTWVPLGDVDLAHGPLAILEKSHLLERVRNTYGKMDVDTDGNWKRYRFRHGRIFKGGQYSPNPRAIQKQFGLRWLTTDFKAGDVLIFTAFTMHGSLDNQTDRIRISTDGRFQPAADPVDERWVGKKPIGHTQAQ